MRASEPGFLIGDWIVRPQRDCIERAGTTVHLAPKAMAVLQCLARAGGEAVPRQQLFDTVWPGCDVTDDALTQRIVEIRKAFGDSAREPTVVETIPRIGFRLIPPVAPVSSPNVPGENRGRGERSSPGVPRTYAFMASTLMFLLVLAGGYLIVRDPDTVRGVETVGGEREAVVELSVAVLPFADHGEGDDDLYLAEAIYEEVLTRLARVKSLKVISHTSAERYFESGKPLREVAGALGVSTVLTGSVQRLENQLRIHAQLLDARTEEFLWAERFDRELTARNWFEIQSEIAEQVATALSASLAPEESAMLAEVPTENFEAYRAVLQGRVALEEGTIEGFDRAIAHYEHALQINPEFAQAHIAIAGAYSTALEDRGIPQIEANAKIQEHSLSALRLNPNLGHAYKLLGQVRRVQGRYDEAEALMRTALALDPGNVHILHGLGLTLRLRGRLLESVPFYDRAAELDPLSPIINESRGSLLRDLGRFEEAEQQYRYTLQIDPEFVYSYWGLGTLYWSMGDPARAVSWFEQAVRLAPASDVFRNWVALMHLELLQDDQARATLDEAQSGVPLMADNDTVLAEELFRIYHGLDVSQVPDGRPFLPRGLHGNLVQLPVREILTRDYVAAIDRYEERYPGITAGEITIDGSNYHAAIYVAFVLDQLGERARALTLLDRAEATLSGMRRLGIHGFWVSDAQIQTIRGDYDLGIELLEAAVQEGWRNLWRFYLLHDPILQALHEQPGFEALADHVRSELVVLPDSRVASRVSPVSANR